MKLSIAIALCFLSTTQLFARPKLPLPLRVIGKVGAFYGRSFKDEYGFHDKFYSSAVLVTDAAEVTDMTIQFKIQAVCPNCYEGGPLFHGESLVASNFGWAAIEQLGLLPLSSWLHRRGERGPEYWKPGNQAMYALSAVPLAFTAGQRISDAAASWPFYKTVRAECRADRLSCE